MADTGIFATTAECLRKSGAKASATSAVEAYTNDFITQAESYINVNTRVNWSDLYSSLNVDKKGLLKLAASNLVAIYVINYDLSGFSSRIEAETMLDVLYDGFVMAMKALESQSNDDFLKAA